MSTLTHRKSHVVADGNLVLQDILIEIHAGSLTLRNPAAAGGNSVPTPADVSSGLNTFVVIFGQFMTTKSQHVTCQTNW